VCFPFSIARSAFFELTARTEIEREKSRVIRGGDGRKIFISLFHSSDQLKKVIDEGECGDKFTSAFVLSAL